MNYCYFLYTECNQTYIGATTDPDRRLRQHNKEISGGAKTTSIKVNMGEIWVRHCYVKGFPDWQSCLQFEWRWKQLTRKLSKIIEPIKRRMIALDELLHLDKPTQKAKPYIEWDNPPEIIYE